FVFALETARQYIENGRAKTVLVIASEMLSRVTDYTDRTTCVLFGDAAGAVVLRASDTCGIKSTYCMSDGSRGDLLVCKGIENKSPFAKPSNEITPDLKDQFIMMRGHDVYKFAVRIMQDAMVRVLDDAGVDASEIRWMVPHQANIRIIKSMADKFALPMDKVYINLDRFGNTSSATIPTALDELNRAGKLRHGDKIVLIGFGGGLTCGAALIEW
ncbi:MAG: beta-ketoacyl-ACP synthase 3, partial [Clostridia bacterium]